MVALRQEAAIRQGAAIRQEAAIRPERGDPCSWFRAPARLAPVAPAHLALARLAQAHRLVPATQWTCPARQKMKAIRRETLPHCLAVLMADPLLPREPAQRHCRAILLSGRAGRL